MWWPFDNEDINFWQLVYILKLVCELLSETLGAGVSRAAEWGGYNDTFDTMIHVVTPPPPLSVTLLYCQCAVTKIELFFGSPFPLNEDRHRCFEYVCPLCDVGNELRWSGDVQLKWDEMFRRCSVKIPDKFSDQIPASTLGTDCELYRSILCLKNLQ